jgi:RNA polymerase sigma factor (sigma-70 family)
MTSVSDGSTPTPPRSHDELSAAFAVVYRQWYPLILTTCERRLGDHARAEDAAAEVFRVAWQRFTDGVEPSVPWLYGIVRNVVGTEYRRTARAAALVERTGGEGLVAEQLPDDPRGLEVRLALSELKPADRELLFMTYWEDLTPAEIAAILEITVASVWMRLTRARAALKKQLERAANADERGR